MNNPKEICQRKKCSACLCFLQNENVHHANTSLLLPISASVRKILCKVNQMDFTDSLVNKTNCITVPNAMPAKIHSNTVC